MSTKRPPARETLTLRDAARFVGLSRESFAKNALPLIPYQKVGGRYLISKAMLRRWLETGKPAK
jgi:hypothetical protein